MKEKFTLRELSRYSLGTFADIIYRNAILYPEQEAFVYGSDRVGFREYNGRVNSLVHGLKALGIRKGEVIGVLSWNRLEYAEVFGAAAKGGFIIAHFNPRLQAEELRHVINDSEARAVFLGPDFSDLVTEIRPRLSKAQFFLVFGDGKEPMMSYGQWRESHSREEPQPEVEEEDPLVIFYTSGTTGIPRGAVYTHRQKMENTLVKALDIGAVLGDRHLVVIPMFHVGGDSHIWPFFLVGGCNVIVPSPSFDPAETLKIIYEERITDVHIVPTQLVALLHLPDREKYDLRDLKRVWYAASPMPVEVLRQGLSAFGPVFLQGYGLTESGPHSTVFRQAHHREAMGDTGDRSVLASCGQPCIGVHMRIVDEAGQDVEAGQIGEILIKSKRIMTRYWRKPDDTQEAIRDGWLYTGDMGTYDERGFVYIADRKKDMIVTGGENVYPKEVEDILYRHPAVREAAVIGVPDDFWVEKVHALVVLKDDARATEEEIVGFCKKHIARYKSPKSVEFVEELPKNPQGKILKKEIRKRYWPEKG
ncbi:MAG: long-chain-fatty-acid--CoA ligase [Deltaproteobacteria bacterium]|nr:long-chain-fatty-acid--CoA ligase [Deltaproteobacteria bacterium]